MTFPNLDWWALSAWIAINIFVPVVLPLLVLWLFSIPTVTANLAAGCVIKSIGHGELFWAAMGMAASTCYELFALQKLVTNPNVYGIAWLMFWIHLGVILGSAIMVGVGSLNNSTPAKGNPHIPDRKVFVASLCALGFTMVSYTVCHAALGALEEEIRQAAGLARQDQPRKEKQRDTEQEQEQEQEQEKGMEKDAILKALIACLAANGNDGIRCLEVLK